MLQKYDIIVVGAGHAGCEAANASATMGSKVLLVTMNMNTIAQMSCNPAIGGVAKGQIVREIDALGGKTGVITDLSMIQFRMLNKSKGPAMWSPRAQNDRMRFAELWRYELEKNGNIDFWQDMVTSLIIENKTVIGVITGMGIKIYAKTVILTNGTFLNGIIHVGEKQFGGGRSAERSSTGITEQLLQLGFKSGRMKTGTPPRVDGRSLDYYRMEEQKGDAKPSKFSFSNRTSPLKKQRSCHITYTNSKVHDILRTGFDQSPMFSGRITGIGPRYCPSVEDKIDRFSDKDRHQIFVEPEGWNTIEVYVNGFSTSLPEHIQYNALKKIQGFEQVKMFRPGYAIEYDFFPPTQLKTTLETNIIHNLYFAGQINGTTGYEEAACQGLMAGINANHKTQGQTPFILNRSEAYIGVLIDDLVNKGTEEPYRMFTSRAEHRLLLRQDNADLRLTKKGYDIGLATKSALDSVNDKKQDVNHLIAKLKSFKVKPIQVNNYLETINTAPIKEGTKLHAFLKRPNITIENLLPMDPKINSLFDHYKNDTLKQVEIEIKYENYIQKESAIAQKMIQLDKIKIRSGFNFSKINGLSIEAREKLTKQRPSTLGQASRISGVSPADISVLMVYIAR